MEFAEAAKAAGLDTPRGVLAAAMSRVGFDGESVANSIINLLGDAGYVIVPRDPAQTMTEHPSYLSGEWSRRAYEAAIRAASETVSK